MLTRIRSSLVLCAASLLCCCCFAWGGGYGACVAGPVSSLLGPPGPPATCDIGSLQFTFNQLNWSVGKYQDFYFTPVSNGFAISYTGGPLTSYIGMGPQDLVSISYEVVDTNGVLTGEHVSSPGLWVSADSVLGTSAYSQGITSLLGGNFITGEYDCSMWGDDYEGGDDYVHCGASQNNYSIEPYHPFVPSSSGSGDAMVFEAFLTDYGSSASWDGSPATFIYDTAPTPEPSTFMLFASGLVVWLAGLRRRLG